MTDTVRIQVNGEAREVAAGTTVRQLLAQLDVTGPRVAVELNRRILPRERFETGLEDGDQIEIVTFVGGG